MASRKVCTDTVTILNRIGRDADRRDVYQATLLANVHAASGEGQIESASVANDTLKLLIFDDQLRVLYGRRYLEHRAFAALTEQEKAAYWTLTPDGSDYIAMGVCPPDEDGHLPEDATLYQIHKVTRHPKGSRRMWHWTVEAI